MGKKPVKKVIVVDKCDNCPFNGLCTPWKSITSRQRVALTISTKYACGFILKDCPLPDNGSEEPFGLLSDVKPPFTMTIKRNT